MRNFQGIIFIWTQTYEKIFKSALVYLQEFSASLYFREESWWCGIFILLFCSNNSMNCVFSYEMKWNDYLLDMRLVLISNYLTTFTQNFSNASVNTSKNYTNLVNVS